MSPPPPVADAPASPPAEQAPVQQAAADAPQPAPANEPKSRRPRFRKTGEAAGQDWTSYNYTAAKAAAAPKVAKAAETAPAAVVADAKPKAKAAELKDFRTQAAMATLKDVNQQLTDYQLSASALRKAAAADDQKANPKPDDGRDSPFGANRFTDDKAGNTSFQFREAAARPEMRSYWDTLGSTKTTKPGLAFKAEV